MDSSNVDVMTTGYIEAQQHNPNWFVDHKYMLRPNQEDEVNKLGYFILKVPEYRRQPPEVYSPHGWRFGLHNRENLGKSDSEDVKLAIAVQYGLVGEKWDHFCNAIVDDPKAMLACYGLQNEVTSWSDEQIKHLLALDALFLATIIDMEFPSSERQLWTTNTLPSWFVANHVFHARFKMQSTIIDSDLYQVENQIPFVLIDKVVEFIHNSVASQTSEGNEPLIPDLQYQQRSVKIVVDKAISFFMATSSEAFKIDNQSNFFGEKTHILGVAYKIISGSKDLLMNQSLCRNEYIHVLSATKLKQSSIKIVGVDGPLCTMSYKYQCLSLPKMNIFHTTIFIIRNMAWYERYSIPNGCLLHDYILLLCDLIQTPEDLDLLIQDGVINNACGIKGFKMWIRVKEGLEQVPSSQMHHDMKIAIVSRCNHRRYRLWSEFKIVFCSRPWVVLSTIVVILVTTTTLIQTYTAIIGSNKMKPKFP